MKQVKIIVALMAGLFSFASVNAGEMTVTGTMQVTYQSEPDSQTGNPLGIENDLKWSASTELDNGTAVDFYIATDGTTLTFDDTRIDYTTPFGKIGVGNNGDPADAKDDVTPSAFEEANGAGAGTFGADIGSNGSMGVFLSNGDILGTGISVAYAHYPKLDATTGGPKAATGDANANVGSGESINIVTSLANLPGIGSTPLGGLTLTLAAEDKESTLTADMQKKEAATVALTYAQGPVKIGYQRKGVADTTTTLAAKTFYKDEIIGIAFAVNDALSISWNKYSSDRHSNASTNVEQEATAYNLSYTMGGLTLGLQSAKVDNAGFAVGTEDETRTISLVTAF